MIVVKVGGSKGIDLDAFCRDLATAIKGGADIVLVHGGSHETNVLSESLGKPPRFVTSISGVESRYTDRETLEIFTMVYVGKVNKYIVEQLQRHGVNAVGFSRHRRPPAGGPAQTVHQGHRGRQTQGAARRLHRQGGARQHRPGPPAARQRLHAGRYPAGHLLRRRGDQRGRRPRGRRARRRPRRGEAGHSLQRARPAARRRTTSPP